MVLYDPTSFQRLLLLLGPATVTATFSGREKAAVSVKRGVSTVAREQRDLARSGLVDKQHCITLALIGTS